MGKRKGRKGKCAKGAEQSSASQEPEELKNAPHTFVIYRGKLGKYTAELLRDFRKVMEPFTASNLKVQKRNVIKDFVSVAGLLHVTHLVVFTKTEISINLRIARLPRGPTLTFRVLNYTLARDVISSLRRQVTYASQFMSHPLLVLNNLSGEGMHLKLIASMFQNMFPSININNVNLNGIRRCVLLNYDAESDTFDFRHYTIKVIPCGVSKPIKKIIQNKVPNLSQFEDISEFITKSGNLSESEAEPDGPENEVVLPQHISSRGNIKSEKSAIRLIELGPRMTLQLIKIEEGLMEGEVIYHKIVSKTPEEVKLLQTRRRKKTLLKKKRKRQQEENVKRKQMQQKDSKARKEKGEKEEEDNKSENDTEQFMKPGGGKPQGTFLKKRKMLQKTENVPRKKMRPEGKTNVEKKQTVKRKEGLSFQKVLEQRRKKKKKQLLKNKKKMLK
ncbi:suppressor of SWI4 1 homolog [Centruroides vittatus]|uniref:suppressor of SWI4 1 homolog n=1 Tax=Centruroides vittatus TaxID=120091 RepID=UPI003510C21B